MRRAALQMAPRQHLGRTQGHQGRPQGHQGRTRLSREERGAGPEVDCLQSCYVYCSAIHIDYVLLCSCRAIPPSRRRGTPSRNPIQTPPTLRRLDCLTAGVPGVVQRRHHTQRMRGIHETANAGYTVPLIAPLARPGHTKPEGKWDRLRPINWQGEPRRHARGAQSPEGGASGGGGRNW